MTAHTQALPSTSVIRTWIDALPPLMVLPPVEEPAPEPVVEETLVVVVMPGRFLSWFLWLFPFGDEITREEAAAIILAREIRVKYTPLIVELDRKNPNIEIR